MGLIRGKNGHILLPLKESVNGQKRKFVIPEQGKVYDGVCRASFTPWGFRNPAFTHGNLVPHG